MLINPKIADAEPVSSLLFEKIQNNNNKKLLPNAICWRIYAFELWCWRRLLRVRWTARTSNQLILKEINTEYSLKGLILNLRYFGRLVRRADSLGKKTLMLGKIKSRRRRGQQKVRWLGGINRHEFEQTPEDSEGQGSLVCCSPRGGRVGHDWAAKHSIAQYSSVWYITFC